MPDDYFGPAVIDVDEERAEPHPHRYVHGAFEGTNTRFSMYFVPEADYRGRFLQWLEGGPGGHEHEASRIVGFAASCGAYIIESNQGHIGVDPGPPDASITGWRASEATARLGREYAREMYGSVPHHGYLYGGSGGGMRTILGLENVRDVWDGGVPFVSGSMTNMAGAASVAPLTANVMRLLGPQLTAVVDAVEPGGSGDPTAGLDDAQASALRALLDAGFQPRALFQLERPSVAALLLPMMMMGLSAGNPQYVEDFWTKEGFPGADGKLADAFVDFRGAIRDVIPTEKLLAEGLVDAAMLSATSVAPSMEMSPIGIVLDNAPQGSKYAMAHLDTGAAKDSTIPCFGTTGEVVVLNASGREQAEAIRAGDAISIDNRVYLAFCHANLFAERYPSSGAAAARMPYEMRGDFTGKMILINSLLDDVVLPAAALAYHELVRSAGRLDNFRLWWTDNAAHVPGMILTQGEPPVMASRLGNYAGSFEQGMRDLIAWVEDGVEPPASSRYELVGSEVVLAQSADQRGGIQPTAKVTANGTLAATVAAGDRVTFELVADVPPRAGRIIAVAWDYDGSGSWTPVSGIDGSQSSVWLTSDHAYEQPGTYFPAVQVVAHRDGDVASTNCRVENLGRARVVVT